MQKWSPELFEEPTPASTSAAVGADFETAAVASSQDKSFRREAGFADTKALMNSLTAKERSQVFELVELDLAKEFQAREEELTREHETSLAAARAETEQLVAIWSERLAAALASELQDAAAAAARLAVQLAQKIVRRTVSVDPTVLARVIETTLYKITTATPLVIHAHPNDAAWLQQQTDLLERLSIGQIVPDRRVDSGGCLIQNEGREWDATLTRQLDTLDEIVAEMIATGAHEPTPLPTAAEVTAPTPANESEPSDDLGLE